MVDAILGPLFQDLNSLVQTKFGLLWDVEEDIEKLSSTLSAIRDVIDDAEMKQYTDKAIANWLRKLKDVAYEADHVLDEWLTEVRRSEMEVTWNSCTQQVSGSTAYCFKFKQPAFRYKIANHIKKVTANFDSIAAGRSKFHLRSGVVERAALLDPNRETSSFVFEPEVYGRDEDQRKIVTMLIGNTGSLNNVSVLSILGIGGLGKTTLAQLVYNDERVSNHFGVRIWVCVSEDFGVKRLMKLIIESFTGKPCDLEALDPIQNHLRELLSGKRFLIVLDDVWNQHQDKWDKIRYTLTCGAEGSSIIVTTRLEMTALIMSTFPVYYLTPLLEDECCSLFMGHAFADGDEDMYTNLVEIGKQIVKKCVGVPLAATVLGALMRFKREVSEWLSIRDSDIWELPEEEGGVILGVLRLSYNYLPPQLRQCFAYCSVYPKDYEMEKKELIRLWMANGFVQRVGRMELEEAGNQIFNELLRGSFFQDVQKDDYGNIEKCKMHDLMYDLACSLSVSECCVIKVDKAMSIPNSMRHLSVIHISISMSHMKCLRYLNFSGSYLRLLPESICSLINLQTLKLVDCRELLMLPKDMRNLRSLRHLDLRGCLKLTKMPSNIGQMICLPTLSFFIVGKKRGHQVNELKTLKHLAGELQLKGLQHVNDSTDAKEVDFVNKQNLTSLELSWKFDDGVDCDLLEAKKSEEVLECLQPHLSLKKLVIKKYGGAVLPSWLHQLENLAEIELGECTRCVSLPPLGKLPLLKVLTICGMKSLKCITEFYQFQSLEQLCVWDFL
ncbi:hypothetical protein AQUCO_09300037v1 [Aquilegia coerulea]|uniref:Disease resistance protein RGA3 n=1 Tax=Aquilegia coerulea TaxID=218851 RepID=A0A2G5C5A9_AQUCA|nr:hypothetical protein AQUCO_09300037v1 [Aquilegia coerulea]